MTREYLFNTLTEKMRSAYAESVIDFCAATVFCEFEGTEEELMETSEKLVEMFWNANEIVIVSQNSTPVRIEFEKHEFSNNFASWRDKTEKFVVELIRKNIRFKELCNDKNGFIATHGYEIYTR